jgi:hypothetical protein
MRTLLLIPLFAAILLVGTSAHISMADAPATPQPANIPPLFQPIHKPALPKVKNTRWPRNPIDLFILAKLEEKGLTPAPEADRYTLIRRLTFDLTGLPPTPEEIRAFLADKSPDAYENLVDRLLASPHYGERWGRHWLDVARYVQGRITFPGVSRSAGDQHYRDYVVRAFNNDKPYDRFVTEQLAGDLLPPAVDRQDYFDQIIAPAFLSIGAWFDMETDPNRLRLEMIDEQINTTSKAFLGLSVACARCHDHKFDPIPTEDYYRLGGIFRSTKLVGEFSDYWRDGRVRQLRQLAMPDEVAANDRIHQQIAAKRAEWWKYLSEQHAELMTAWKADEARLRDAAAKIPRPFVKLFEAEDFNGQSGLRIAQLMRDGKGVEVIETLLPKAQWVKYIPEVPETAQYRLEALYSTEEKTPITVTVNGAVIATNALSTPTGGADLKFQRWATVGTFELREGMNFIRLDAKEGLFPRLDRFRLYKLDPAIEQRIRETADALKCNPLLLANLVYDPEDPWPQIAGIEPYLDESKRTTAAAMTAECERLAAEIKPYDLAISVTDQSQPTDLPVHPRGSTYATRDEPNPRGVPHLLDHALPPPIIPPDHSGRLELAQWLTDPRNPLPSHVMVNRIWHWHFGRGIVASTSDFGSRGTPPTNPDLLDWLAATFMSGTSDSLLRYSGGGFGWGLSSSAKLSKEPPLHPSPGVPEEGEKHSPAWSIKRLHRLVLTSSTYRMSSRADAVPSDPDNKLLSHFPRQRLDAEALFDAMFTTRNIMPRQASGQPLDVEKSKGRALYVLTSGRSPEGLGLEVRKMLSLFDYDASGAPIAERPTSQTPAQSLFWLNSPLVKYYADKFAERLLKMDRLDDAKRVEMAYLIALGHPPSKEVAEESLAFLEQCEKDEGMTKQQGWTKFCQALFGCSEFRYVD